jgi:hypothetical protein
MRLPGDEELVAYLDGEVAPERRHEIDRLLRISPVVRERLAAIREDAEVSVRAFDRAEPPWPAQDGLWDSLRRRLDEPAGRAPSFAARLRECTPWPRLGAAAAVACVTFAALLWMAAPPAYTAGEVLARARKAEARRLDGVLAPVIHRRLRIVRKQRAAADVAVLDSWTAAASGENRERLDTPAADPVWSDLNRVLAANGIDRHALLSPDAYQAWRATRERATDRVRRARDRRGEETFTISTLIAGAAEGEVVRSDYVVRAADWSPLANRLQVRSAEGETGYDIEEEEYAVVARASLPPDYFAALAPLSAPHPPATRRTPDHAPPAGASEAAPAPVAPVDDEIAAVYAIHRAGACDREPLRVEASEGRIVIAGAVSAVERRRQIAAWLALHPAVEARLEIAPRKDVGEAPGAGALDRLLRAANAAAPLRSAAELDALKLSLDSFLDLIDSDRDALVALAARFPETRLAEAGPAARKQLREMLEEHLAALAGNLRRVATLIDGAPTVAPAARQGGAGWQAATHDLSDAISRLVSVPPNAVPANAVPADALRATADSLRRLGAQAEGVRVLLTAVTLP